MKRAVLPAVLSALVVLGLWLAVRQLNQTEQWVFIPGSEELAHNAFYTLERLSQRFGFSAQSIRYPPAASELGKHDTLVLSTPFSSLAPASADAVLRWVQTGGQLIAGFNTPVGYNRNERLKEHFAFDTEPLGEPLSTLVGLPSGLQVHFISTVQLHDARRLAYRSVTRDGRHYLLQYRLGAGTVTLLSDIAMFSNSRIVHYDHADFFYRLLRPETTKVWLQFILASPSFWALIWQRAWPLICSLGLVLLFVLWACASRLGPILSAAPGPRRQHLEHIRASGRFLWRHGARYPLIAAVRRHLLHRIHHRYPNWQILSDQQRIQTLASSLDLAPRDIERALHHTGERTIHRAEFLHIIKTLQTIEKRL